MTLSTETITKVSPQLSKQEILGASRLAIQAVIGITDAVEAMHSNISRVAPVIGRGRSGRARGLSGQIYSSVRGITRTVGFGLEAAHRILPSIHLKSSHHRTREALVSRINGVFGDHLESSQNPLAIPMSLRHNGQRLLNIQDCDANSTSILPRNPRPVIFVHGLCMNDLQWQVNGHDHGAVLAQELGIAPLYLHYNSGRRIADNGRELAMLLEAMFEQWPCELEELVLVGHSMGGLVSRSAVHYAQAHRHQWLEKLSTAVFLGSPHHGAPLERIGHLAGKLLEASPYSAPIARLGRVRSAGIQDLRHGRVIDDESGSDGVPNRFPDHLDVHSIAASLSAIDGTKNGKLKGDGLVPINSALGQHRDQSKSLGLPEQNQHLILNTGHLQLLESRMVYTKLKAVIEDVIEDVTEDVI